MEDNLHLRVRLKALRDRLHAQSDENHQHVGWHPDGFIVDDAIEWIALLIAEIERLRKQPKLFCAALSTGVCDQVARAEAAEAKRREAVEVMRAMREETAALLERYDDQEQSNHPNAYVMLQRIAAFLATMEKPREP